MKKLLPAILALVLVTATALTACGKKDMTDDNESTTASTTRSTTDMSQAADEFGEDMKSDVNEMKSDVEDMIPGDDDNVTSAKTAE